MKKNLLVVVDMVNGFVKFGALHDEKINEITPTIIEAIKFAKLNDFEIVNFRDSHNENDEEFKIFPKHCLKGTDESKLIDELKPYQQYFDYDIEKTTTNGFVTKEFQELVKKENFDNVLITGCCTDICVLNFFNSYNEFIKNNNLKTKLIVLDNACATFDAEGHRAKEIHRKAINNMKKHGAIIKDFPIKEEDKIL